MRADPRAARSRRRHRSRTRRDPRHDRPRAVAGRDRRARRVAARRGPRPAGDRRGRARRRDPGLVPERRPARPRRDASTRCGRPLPPPRRPRRRGRLRDRGRPLARVRRDASTPSPAPRSRPTRACRSRSTSRCPPLDVDYALHRDLAPARAVRPGQPGAAPDRPRPDRDPRPGRQRRPYPAHPAPRLDVLDGIAFGRPDLAETVHEGDRVDVVARLTSRTFGGYESLQLDIRDVATSGLGWRRRPAGSSASGERVRDRGSRRGRWRRDPARRPARGARHRATRTGSARSPASSGPRSRSSSCRRRARDPEPVQRPGAVRPDPTARRQRRPGGGDNGPPPRPPRRTS